MINALHHPAVDAIIAAGYYKPPLSRVIARLKYTGHWQYSRFLARCLFERLDDVSDKPEVLIPVPMHTNRLYDRGFNQAMEIARELSSMMNIPVKSSYCSKILETIPQTDLNRSQRMDNLKKAFCINLPSTVSHVAIIDDVVTTGTTVVRMAQGLKQAGVKTVQVWCIARA